MKTAFYTFSKDKTLISGYGWNSIKNPLAIVFIVHGLGGHLMRFDELAREYNRRNIAVYGIDLRGHGGSDGKRGHVNSLKDYFDDIECGISKVRKSFHKDVSLYIYGNSMGATIALLFALNKTIGIKGLILTSPWFELVKEPNVFSILLLKLINKIYPSFLLKTGVKIAAPGDKEEKKDKSKKDLLAHPFISSRLFLGIYYKSKSLILTRTNALDFPVLVFHGDKDTVTKCESSEKFCKLNNPWTTFVKIKDGRHEFHMGKHCNEIVITSTEWIKKGIWKE